MLESTYQAKLIKRIKRRLPGCMVLKNDTDYIQGVPDLLVLHKDRWAALEVKASATAEQQPNQDYYVESMGEMSFAAFVYPENEEDVLDELQRSLTDRRTARVSKR